MINLVGKYVPNEEGVLRDLFIAECERQGLKQYSETTLEKRRWPYICVVEGLLRGGNLNIIEECAILTLADFKPSVPSWNNKTPCEMTKEEALEFISDRFDGVEMEFRSLPFGDWCSACMTPLGIVRDSLYRIKPQTNRTTD